MAFGNGFEQIHSGSAEMPSVEDVESKVEALLSGLPDELADRFEDAHKDADPEERYDSLVRLIEARKKARLERADSDRNPEHVSVVEQSPLAILKLIERIEHESYTTLGTGLSGVVIASERYENICHKVMFPIERVPVGTNDISVEADLQDEISNLGEIEGVRAPRVMTFVHKDNMRAITMERLDAVAIRDVIEGKELLPDAFDPERFMRSLTAYIEALNGRGYYHRDLHEGNVMIDRTSGMPYVIDFGMAKYSPFLEDAYELSTIENGHKVDIVLPLDTESLKRLQHKIDLLVRPS